MPGIRNKLMRDIKVPQGSGLSREDYEKFLQESFRLLSGFAQYLSESEDINCLELAHLIPAVNETVLAVYLGINDAVCNKGLITSFLIRHGHNNVFVFEPEVFGGGDDVPGGTIDAQRVLNGFEPPNESWDGDWTYVMIEDTARSFESLWCEKGYIDMIPAKFEDFTMLSDHSKSRVCFFIDAKAFEHPVNAARPYLSHAKERGKKLSSKFKIPDALDGEVDGLVPVVLHKGEKLYVAGPDFGPCAHAWSNIHPDNEEMAVINENSAIPLELILAKPVVNNRYAGKIIPPRGSADMTTDWFYRGQMVVREPILHGAVKG